MNDPWVKGVQEWLNDTYSGVVGWTPVDATGRTGWPTMRALTRALQHELGIENLSNTFGPGTIAALTAIGDIGATTIHSRISNIYNILIGGLYCKGYNAGNGGLPGEWHGRTTGAVMELQANIGIPQNGLISPKLFRAVLNMDAYVLIREGRAAVREVQQWMNGTYIDRDWFSIVPADGLYSRDVQRALVFALQSELGVAGANGTYGPGTRTAVRSASTISSGSEDSPTGNWVRLFQAALRFNTYECQFDGVFTSHDAEIVRGFQRFCHLDVTGSSNYQTWSSLLVSNGDPDRVGEAVDCITTITPARGSTLISHGRKIVGRYLTNAPGPSSLNKRLQYGELDTIFSSGLRVFPIYQTTGTSANYFSTTQGAIDAELAVQAAVGYGFENDTTIYFAVDFDEAYSEVA